MNTPREFDFIVVGGGTAGCIVAARLASLPSHPTVALIERGPDDTHEQRAQKIRRWDQMVESEYAVHHQSVEQDRGNSEIDHTRLHILGGCSTANTMISWVPFAGDLQEWEKRGAAGWGPESFLPYADRLRTRISVIPSYDQNPQLSRILDSASSALGLDRVTEWNTGNGYKPGAGFFEIGYIPETNQRSSASNAYRDLITRAQLRGNLTLLTDHRVDQLVLEGARESPTATAGMGADEPTCTGVSVTVPSATDASPTQFDLHARREVVLSAGAFESPRLLMLSGIGSPDVLESAGVKPKVALPGVGENLQDHAEGLVVWETREQRGPQSATGWDSGYLWGNEHGPRTDFSDLDPVPEVTTHVPCDPWVEQLERAGIDLPKNIAGVAPNVSRPSSRGRLWITSEHPDARMEIDFRYFTDPAGHDEKALIAGVRNARLLAEQAPFSEDIVREVFPGPGIESDEQISEAQRAIHQTVYHPCGTCSIGAADDPMAVLDSELQVRGVRGLRVADASAFPTITSINPVVTIMMLAERCSELMSGSIEVPEHY